MKKNAKKGYILLVIILILGMIGFNIYTHFTKYSPENWLKYFGNTKELNMINHFSFWWYIRTYGVANIIAFLMPALLVIAGVRSFFDTYRSGFLQNIILRTGYSKAIKVEILKSWLAGGIVLPIISIITFIISFILFPNSRIVPFNQTNGIPFLIVPNIMLEINPYLFLIIYTIIIFIFSIIIINIGVILVRYIKSFYLVIVGSFISFIFVELVGQMILGPLVASISNISKMANGFSLFNLYYLDAIPSLWWEIFFAVLMVLISTYVIYKIYREKEEVIFNYE